MASIHTEASSSTMTGATSNHHMATFVFDAGLRREAFLRVIEAQGQIHRLVQRLMEKHGGEDKVSELTFLCTYCLC
jgi:hypothetical protein